MGTLRAYHGYVRYTGDLDLFVELSPNNAAKLSLRFANLASTCPSSNPHYSSERANCPLGV